MKTYCNEAHKFTIEIPEGWSLPSSSDRNPGFDCGKEETFNFEIGPLSPEPQLEDTERDFRQYADYLGYDNVTLGRITVQGKEHIWARYHVPNLGWLKKFMLVFNGIEYATTAGSGDLKIFMAGEQVWDQVVSSFRKQ